MQGFIYKKNVDQSLLKEGFSIRLEFQDRFIEQCGGSIDRGEKHPITILLDGEPYDAKLINQPFDPKRYPEHCRVLQVRYSPTSPLAEKLRQIFYISLRDIKQRKILAKSREHLVSSNESLCLYGTDRKDVFVAECVTVSDIRAESRFVRKMDELQWENSIVNAEDPTATIVTKAGTLKLRKLDVSICSALKGLYGFRCQICGCEFSEYGSSLIHAHHIEPFTESLNNDAQNIMVLCPNHHGIVHNVHPQFVRSRLLWRYPNGVQEPLKINLHLGSSR